jgi:hypothetical protein
MTDSRFLLTAATLCVSVLFYGVIMPAVAAPDQPAKTLAQAGSPSSVTMTPTEADAGTKLEQAGYADIRDVKSGPEGISATATKDGRKASLVIDSGGTIRQR